jgi:hypothetical protein
MEITFKREKNYTAEDRKKAMKSKIGRIVYDGTPTVIDPLGMIRGISYVAWFRPLGLTIRLDRLYATTVSLKRSGVQAVDGQ